MLFNSFEFIFLFLPLTIILFFLIGKFSHKLTLAWLCIASLIFYGYWNINFLSLLLVSVFFNFIAGKIITNFAREHQLRSSKIALITAVSANLLLLAYFKYMNFFIDIINQITITKHDLFNLILPLGISFFSFTQIAYLADCFQGKTKESNFLSYLLFVVYFPHLIAGPILHHSEMIPQFNNKEIVKHYKNFTPGLVMFLIGLGKKLFFADGIAELANTLFTSAQTGSLSTSDAWLGALAYTMQIYFDFSGYSDMAIGISFMFGIRLPINFNSPYKSSSIIEFWHRWHMTLSRFLRDYLYIPLGGNQKGIIRKHANLLITMLLGGLWHGAGWTFLLWGGLHGGYLILNHAWRFLCEKLEFRFTGFLYRIFSILLTFLCVTWGWVLFRSPNLKLATIYFRSMLGMQNSTIVSHDLFLRDKVFLIVLLAIAFLLPNSLVIMEKANMILIDNKNVLDGNNKWYQWSMTRKWGIISGLMFGILVIGIFSVGDGAQFLYFQF